MTKAAILLSALVPALAQTGPVVLKSPNGALELSIATLQKGAPVDAAGQLAYRVSFRGKPVFDWSALGLTIQSAPPLGNAVRITSSSTSQKDEMWISPHGKASKIRDHYNGVTVEAAEPEGLGRPIGIEARAYDDGVAFRYVIPVHYRTRVLRISGESTRFNASKDGTAYALLLPNYRTHYEDDYHVLGLNGIGLHPEYLIGLPLLMEFPGVAWVGITEANIDNWAGLYLTGIRFENALEARLSPRIDEPGLAVATGAPAASPWRVLMIADDPGRLIESNLVLNLNPPSAIADTSWIKAGKAAWDWWTASQAKNVPFKPGMNTATMKHYIDFAARNGFEYMLIDGGWSAPDLTHAVPDIDMPELLAHAKSKNVRLWLWASWVDVEANLEEAFATFEKWGVAGVKIDLMNRDDQWMVNWYKRVAQTAAKHKLMVDFHGAYKPDGMERTYPNIMTREGVMALEYAKWSARITPPHTVMVAFTRMLAGPLDYTPGAFDNVTKEAFEPRDEFPMNMGTRAQQLALYVVLECPFPMISDYPGAYEGQKELAFLRAVPATWDETRVLNGKPGKYVTIARRRGAEWYIGSITDWDARDLEVPLSFLGDGTYVAETYADAPDAATEPKHTTRLEERVNAKGVLKLKLAPGGGAAIRLVPAK